MPGLPSWTCTRKLSTTAAVGRRASLRTARTVGNRAGKGNATGLTSFDRLTGPQGPTCWRSPRCNDIVDGVGHPRLDAHTFTTSNALGYGGRYEYWRWSARA